MPNEQASTSSDKATERLENAIDTLDEKLSGKIDAVKDAFQTFQQSLPDSYIPRREFMEVISAIREQTSTLNANVATLNEWRLAETKAAALTSAALENKINAAVLQAMKDNMTISQTAQQAVASERKTADARTISLFQAIIFMLISTGISALIMVVWYLIQHATFR